MQCWYEQMQLQQDLTQSVAGQEISGNLQPLVLENVTFQPGAGAITPLDMQGMRRASCRLCDHRAQIHIF